MQCSAVRRRVTSSSPGLDAPLSASSTPAKSARTHLNLGNLRLVSHDAALAVRAAFVPFADSRQPSSIAWAFSPRPSSPLAFLPASIAETVSRQASKQASQPGSKRARDRQVQLSSMSIDAPPGSMQPFCTQRAVLYQTANVR